VRDELAGLLAHDLKTPLAAIAMNLDYALSDFRDATPDGLRSALEDCRQANSRAIRIVSDMADVVRLAVGDYRPVVTAVAPRELIDGVVRRGTEDAASRGVELRCQSDERPIEADEALLGRALDRLVERALRFARTGSVCSIRHEGSLISIRAVTSVETRFDPSVRALTTHFAEAALRAQGATLAAETDPEGTLIYRISLASP
jgi:signal transduction histidine kinase